MAQKNTETDEDMPIEEVKAIEPDFTGLPIEVHFRRHFQFIVILSICLFLGYIVFALTLLAWVTTVRWAENLCLSAQSSEEAWVNFKLFGTLGLTLVLIVITVLMLSKHIKEKQADT